MYNSTIKQIFQKADFLRNEIFLDSSKIIEENPETKSSNINELRENLEKCQQVTLTDHLKHVFKIRVYYSFYRKTNCLKKISNVCQTTNKNDLKKFYVNLFGSN